MPEPVDLIVILPLACFGVASRAIAIGTGAIGVYRTCGGGQAAGCSMTQLRGALTGGGSKRRRVGTHVKSVARGRARRDEARDLLATWRLGNERHAWAKVVGNRDSESRGHRSMVRVVFRGVPPVNHKVTSLQKLGFLLSVYHGMKKSS